MRKTKGISLIVLVITIIIIIILAGTVILSLTNNNPIMSAEEAKFKSNADTYSTEFDIYSSAKYAERTYDENLEVSTANIKNYVTSLSTEDESKYVIQDGELTFIGASRKERDWINKSEILNGNVPEASNINSYNVSAISESTRSGAITADGRYVSITGMTVNGTETHAYVNLVGKDFNLVRRQDLYLGINTYFREVMTLENGNIVAVGYTLNATNVSTAVMVMYNSNLDEIKRVIYPIPKTNYTSWARDVIKIPGGFMVIASAERYNTSNQITDAYASLYSYDLNGNPIIVNAEARCLDSSLFLVYGGIATPDGKVYLCGNNYKSGKLKPNVVGINSSGTANYEYISPIAESFGEYRYASALSDGRVVLLKIVCSSNASGNWYDTAVESVDFLNVKDSTVTNTALGIAPGLPKSADIQVGYNDSVIVPTVAGTGSPVVYKYNIYKISSTGVIRWNSLWTGENANYIVKALNNGKNKYVVFGISKATSTDPFNSYVTELIP